VASLKTPLGSRVAKACLEYVLVDDATFRKTEWSQERSRYAWIVEESSYAVKVLFYR
jgi:hypothetical protein